MLTGQDLDGVRQLYFSNPKISATLRKPPTTAPTEPLRFDVSIAADAPTGVYDLRALGRFGLTNPRAFFVGSIPQTSAKPDNVAPDKAIEISPETAVYAAAAANADQFYRFNLKAGQLVCLNVATQRLDSRMEPDLLASDPSGREIARSVEGRPLWLNAATDGSYLIAVHDLLYRGGPDYFYRLCVSTTADDETVLPPAAAFIDDDLFSLLKHISADRLPHDTVASARTIQPPCEVEGEFRSPRYRAWYGFDLPAGGTYRIDVTSQRLGAAAAPLLVLQRADAKGNLTDVPLTPETPSPGIPEFPTSTRDPVARVEVKEAGSYRLLVRNLFGSSAGGDTSVPYRLTVCRASPDFRLVAAPASPLPEPADSRDVPVWSTLLRRGGAAPINVAVSRRDGFDGEIHLRVDGLPPGVSADETLIPAGATSGRILVVARDDAAGWHGPIQVRGIANIGGRRVGHSARAGVVVDRSYDPGSKAIAVQSRRSDELVVAVSNEEHSPLTITPATTQATVGTKISIPVALTRRAEFTTPVTLKLAGHALLGPSPAQPVDTKSPTAALALDLAAIKLPAGDYVLYAEGQGKLKYTGPDGKAPAKELTASFYSSPFVLKVLPPPTTQPVKK